VTGTLVLAVILALGRAGVAAPTVVTTWHPFDATGAVKPSLKLDYRGRGGCSPVSEAIGYFGYRCAVKNFIDDPCWRDGPRATDLVVCPTSPWDRKVSVIRVPHFMFVAGVTFAPPLDRRRDPPWAIELVDGNRCVIAQGAHGTVTERHGNRITVDYYCERGTVVLLRNLRRGHVWRIGTAKLAGGHYRLMRPATVRRAIFPSLPPPMQRQNDIARAAAKASGLRVSDLLRVRLTFPSLDWAWVETLAPETSKAVEVSAVVHRSHGTWTRVRVTRPVCRSAKLPESVRRQLFGCRHP
jgi:hypothetical protein